MLRRARGNGDGPKEGGGEEEEIREGQEVESGAIVEERGNPPALNCQFQYRSCNGCSPPSLRTELSVASRQKGRRAHDSKQDKPMTPPPAAPPLQPFTPFYSLRVAPTRRPSAQAHV